MRRITIDGAYVESLQCPASQDASLYSEEFHDDNRGVWNWHFHFFIQCIQNESIPMSHVLYLSHQGNYRVNCITRYGWWLWSCREGWSQFDFVILFQGEWNVMMVFFFMKFLSIAEWDYYNVSVFLCVFPSYVIWISLCIMLHADTDKRKSVVVCGSVGDWTMKGKYELTSVIITEDIAHSHTTEEPEKRRKWTFATRDENYFLRFFFFQHVSQYSRINIFQEVHVTLTQYVLISYLIKRPYTLNSSIFFSVCDFFSLLI